MKTYAPTPDHIERSWYVVDASGMVLGRLASEVAALLRGKHKPIFAPHMDCGDHVIVINADQVTLSGAKAEKKLAHRHSGYPGGITSTSYGVLMADRPAFVVEKAIKGMLPKNRLGRTMIKKLHVMPGADHPHAAQQPVPYTLGSPPAWTGLPEPRRRAARPVEPAAEPTPAATPSAKQTTTPAASGASAKETAATAKASSAKTRTATKEPATAKKSTTAKKTTAAKKSTTAKKTTAAKKSTTAKKTTAAKKSTAKKSTAKKSTATKAAAKKPSAPEAE